MKKNYTQRAAQWERKIVSTRALIMTLLALVTLCPLGDCLGQGTTTFTFEGPPYVGGPSPQPPGTYTTISSYTESGMRFWNPYGLENLATIGAGLAGAPNNGTAHLDIAGRAKLGFSFNTFPGTYFDLVSFDAAGEDISFPGTTLEVVGYKGMSGTVTNSFILDSLASRRANGLPDFQTFYLDSQFQNVYRVDVLTDRWSLDNLVISRVPEPSFCTLLLLGAVYGLGRKQIRGRPLP